MRLYTTSQVRQAYDDLGNGYPPAVLELLDLEDALATGSADSISRANAGIERSKDAIHHAFADSPKVALSLIADITAEEDRLRKLKPPATNISAAARRLPSPVAEPSTNVDGEPVVAIVWFPPERLYLAPSAPFTFRREAQGIAVTGTFEQLAKFLGRSRQGDPMLDPSIAKRARGGWVGGMFTGNQRTVRAFASTSLLIVDIDGGDPHAVAAALGMYRCIVHGTYQGTRELPRCRAVILLARLCTSARDYTTGHAIVREGLAARGFRVDDGAHDVARLNYMPMHQVGVTPVHVVTTGRPLDLGRLVATAPRTTTTQATPATRPASSAYAQRALRHAVEHVATAPSGERHNLLFREAASLARPQLALDDDSVVGALLPAAEAADPETESREHRRVIRDGIEAGRRGS